MITPIKMLLPVPKVMKTLLLLLKSTTSLPMPQLKTLLLTPMPQILLFSLLYFVINPVFVSSYSGRLTHWFLYKLYTLLNASFTSFIHLWFWCILLHEIFVFYPNILGIYVWLESLYFSGSVLRAKLNIMLICRAFMFSCFRNYL